MAGRRRKRRPRRRPSLRLFVDSSALIALADRSDGQHAAALRFYREEAARSRLYTSLFVLDEVATRLRAAIGAEAAEQTVRAVLESRRWEVVEVARICFLEALGLLVRYREHRLSLTDCTSFVVMRNLVLTDAFTFDADFLRAGFNAHPAAKA